jgi:hypothetical protein
MLAVIEPLDREQVAEHGSREREADTMLAQVGGHLRVVLAEPGHEYWFFVDAIKVIGSDSRLVSCPLGPRRRPVRR